MEISWTKSDTKLLVKRDTLGIIIESEYLQGLISLRQSSECSINCMTEPEE